MKIDEVIRKAVERFGVDHQIFKAVSECAELIVALTHESEGKNTPYDVAGEIADVQIMVWQLSLMYPDTKKRIREKVKRLSNLIECST